jgi:hypothetical protein
MHQKPTKMKKINAIIILLTVWLFSASTSSAQTMRLETVSGHVMVISNPEVGESQVVIHSEKGLVVLNSFWSAIPAGLYKKEMIKELDRDDFAFLINTVDRLDLFGGNAVYEEATIIGHQSFLAKYRGREKEVEAEIQDLIDMWRWKEKVSRDRLETYEAGSEDAVVEENWMHTCKRRADELETGFSLVLPDIFYSDRMSLDLGDLTLNLVWFGRAGNYDGMTLVVIPEEKLAVISGFIIHSHHLAPYPYSVYATLDVPRWIAVLEEILEGEDAVEKIICGNQEVWPREKAHAHLEYIRKLWNAVGRMESEGHELPEIQDHLSLDNDFAFVKDMHVYTENGDDWVRPQHRDHVKLFFLQHKTLASEIIKNGGLDALQESLAQIRNQQADLYFDEFSMNAIGYYLLNMQKISEAIEVFKLNVEQFPESSNAYDSLAEAHMQSGNDKAAIQNYQRSLELNPNNENAREMLEKLRKH